MTKKHNNGKQNQIAKLFEAVANGSDDEVKDLLDKGVSPDARDDMARTPLMVAAENGHWPLVRTLIERGADVNAVDVDGETPLIAASYSKDINVVKPLVEGGADLNVRNNHGSTALDIARDMDAAEVAAYLAAQSASPESLPEADHENQGADAHTTTADVEGDESEEPDEPSETFGSGIAEKPAVIVAPATAMGAAAQQAPSLEPEQDVDHGMVVTAHHHEEPISNIVADFVAQDSLAQDAGIPETAVSDPFIDKVVDRVNSIAEETVNRGGFEIGEFVLETIFRNDLKLARSKNPNKSASFTRLSEHHGLRVHPKRISQWVRAVAFYRQMLEDGIDLSNLRISHLVELLPLENEDKRKELAEEANAYRYSVRQLRDKVKDKVTELRQVVAPVDKGQIILRKMVHPLSLMADAELMRFLSDKESLQRELTSVERLKILSDLKKNKEAFDNFLDLIEQLETNLFEIEQEQRG